MDTCKNKKNYGHVFPNAKHVLISLYLSNDLLTVCVCLAVPSMLSLAPCGQVSPYGDVELGQHWLRLWLVDDIKPVPEQVLTLAFTSGQFQWKIQKLSTRNGACWNPASEIPIWSPMSQWIDIFCENDILFSYIVNDKAIDTITSAYYSPVHLKHNNKRNEPMLSNWNWSYVSA